MIPALLSCVFVVYLYHSLRQEPSATAAPAAAASGDTDELAELTQRMAALEDRLYRLARQTSSQGAQP